MLIYIYIIYIFYRSEPTKLDYDVMLALADSDIDKSTYPCITHWLSLIKSYPEEEQRR